MISLRYSDYQKIWEYACQSLPNEACGLLGGTIKDNDRVVEKVYLLTNADNSPEHFSLKGEEQFQTIRDLRKNKWVLLGNFHSHPASPSRPSAEDQRLAFDPAASYLILSLQDRDRPVLKSFRIQQGIVTEEKLLILRDEQKDDTAGNLS